MMGTEEIKWMVEDSKGSLHSTSGSVDMCLMEPCHISSSTTSSHPRQMSVRHCAERQAQGERQQASPSGGRHLVTSLKARDMTMLHDSWHHTSRSPSSHSSRQDQHHQHLTTPRSTCPTSPTWRATCFRDILPGSEMLVPTGTMRGV